MKRFFLILLALLTVIATFPACTPDAPSDETTDGVTEGTTVGDATEAPTEPAEPDETNEEATSPIDPAKKYREDWEDDDPENPFYNLIPVGKSYDGKTTCYDGRYDFGYAVAQTSDGQYFYSVQEAVWHIEEMGGGSIHMREHTDICLYIEMPDDYCDYRLFYEFKNVDFVFNFGQVYDDCTPNAEGINGYAYYSDLFILDGFNNLGDTNVWIIKNEEFTEPGRYLMIDEFNDDPEYWFLYQYVQDGNLSDWPGLPLGEFLPEN
jgi:hypothetical protein